jgi:polysaccharide export outer membrane protein
LIKFHANRFRHKDIQITGLNRRLILAACPSLGLTAAGLAACAAMVAPGSALPPLPASPAGPYRLGAGDQINLRIYDQSQLSGQYAVDDSGFIDLPLIGLVSAGGSSPDQLAARIAVALQSQQLILHPSVAVEVSRYRPFYILGEVNTPGQYPFRPDMTVLTAISIAGGFTYRAEEDYAGITREHGGQAVQYRAPTNALAEPGDVITVFERRF